ncbi:MAG: Eco57I restriction-modification methylase domain-containing protein [Bacteroidales bacterium]|nr:Eco57I restriction-modification methylase domain-containing protein [Bacteroidales bacterium]
MFKVDRKYQAYYTKSEPIVDYMVNNLSIQPDDKIFEPCGGDGVFIEAILQQNENANIEVFELNSDTVKGLIEQFSHYPNVKIKETDTLIDNDLTLNSNFGKKYDKIIANPPYGAWQDYNKRKGLKKIFPNLYTKETYTLFFFRCIEALKDGGRLVFIIPDTYLNLHMHKYIREYILTKTKIKEILLFPSSFFPGVNFGYANLSIITLEKWNIHNECLNNEFRVISNFQKVNQLFEPESEKLKTHYFKQKDIYCNPDYAFLIADNPQVLNIINSVKTKISDIANCVTGFYSGNDKEYLQVISSNLKNGKNYQVVDKYKINKNYSKIPNILDGISGQDYFIPIVKGGNIKFLKPDNWFMDWSNESVQHYKLDRKARFQNPQYYFKYGIAVPMVSSSQITASLIENKLFDQSIVGIFPKNKNMIYYLLAFFNSLTCNKLIRTINPSANNPANYIKKIPFIAPNDREFKEINQIIQQIITDLKENITYNPKLELELNTIIQDIYGF